LQISQGGVNVSGLKFPIAAEFGRVSTAAAGGGGRAGDLAGDPPFGDLECGLDGGVSKSIVAVVRVGVGVGVGGW